MLSLPVGGPFNASLTLPERDAAARARTLSPAGETPRVLVRGVDLNTADARELAALPGVGGTLAARIVAWREENGPYTCEQELLLVRGIGEKTLSKICGYMEEE